MDRKEYNEAQARSLYEEGRRLALKSACVGCIIFGFLYLVLVYVNTYLIEKIDAPFDLFTLSFTIVGTLITTLIAIALSYFPARFMGGRLANALEADAHNHILSESSATAKGARFGAVAACMVFLLNPGLFMMGKMERPI